MAIKANAQRFVDAERLVYDVIFPHEMSKDQVEEFIRSIGKNLRGGGLGGVPTVVFETWASASGITHRLRLPKHAATYLLDQIRGAIEGIDISEVSPQLTPDDDSDIAPVGYGSDENVTYWQNANEEFGDQRVQVGLVQSSVLIDPLISTLQKTNDVTVGFQYGATLHLRNSSEELPINSVLGFSDRIIRSFRDASDEHDTVVTQWIIAHSNNQKQPPGDKPVQTQRHGIAFNLLFGEVKAGRDEVHSRRTKQQDQNFIATGRVAARGSTVNRAIQLVSQVVRAYTSEGGTAHFYAKGETPQQISHDIRTARTPLRMTAQLNVQELAGVIGWPMGESYVPGLVRGSTRHMPAPEAVPRSGRLLGMSTMPGSNRSIAMSPRAATTHMYIAGGTGVGKTTLMVNTIRQDMDDGAGIILIEREGNLFHQALDQVPPHRKKDVICIDLTQSDRPVGLNLLRLNKPEIVAGQLATLLDSLYPDNKSVYANQLVRHAIPVLANLPRATIADLIPLAHPRTPVEKQWARAAVAAAPDNVYRDYWNDWYKGLDTKDQRQITQNTVPLKNRMWDILTPEPTRYLLNQETSSFSPAEVIRGNKLLFVNLAGVSEQVASMIGTMIVTAMWTAAKGSNPARPNYMYLDEFQQFSHLSNDFEDMLAEARKYNLGLVIATQYIERLGRSVQDAVMANARTKIIFQSSSGSAGIHAQDFASQHVRRESFMNLKAHDALARINTETGISEPITLHTQPAPDGYNNGKAILAMSAATYGRDPAAIATADQSRRIAPHTSSSTKRKDIGESDYTPEGE